MTKKMISVRLDEETIILLKNIMGGTGLSQTEIIEHGITMLIAKIMKDKDMEKSCLKCVRLSIEINKIQGEL